jgi:hypothetical protein
MDVDAAPVAAEGAANGEGASKKRKYYVGEDGVGVWRPNMEVGNFMLDGVGESRLDTLALRLAY